MQVHNLLFSNICHVLGMPHPESEGNGASPPHRNQIRYNRLSVLSGRLLISTANYYYTSSSSPSEPGRFQVL